MNTKQFGALLVSLTLITQIVSLVIMNSMWMKYGNTGLGISVLVSLGLYLAVFSGLHKVKIVDNNTEKSFSEIGDVLGLIPWLMLGILILTIIGSVMGYYSSKKYGKDSTLGIMISMVNTGLLIVGMAAANSIFKKRDV